MKFLKWLFKLCGLIFLGCTFGWLLLLIYAAVTDSGENFVVDWLSDVLDPIDRVLS